MSNSESIFVTEPNELITKVTKELQQTVVDKDQVPYGYIAIKLDSLGKLGNPKVLHFRNYSMEEVLELSTAKEENFIEVLIKCLNKMVYEKNFNCSDLHEKELEEVLLYLYSNFWNKSLDGYLYYLDDTITDVSKKNSDSNIGRASIPIDRLKTNTFTKEFKEPITITINNVKVKFRLARIKDLINAREYINNKYFDTERTLSDVKAAIDKKEKISYESQKKYDDYLNEKGLDFLKAYQSSIILSVNDKILETLEEKMNEYRNINILFWQKYQEVVNDNINFGVDPEVTFFSIELKKEVTRRFSFQSMDFIPTLELSTDTGATVSFGD